MSEIKNYDKPIEIQNIESINCTSVKFNEEFIQFLRLLLGQIVGLEKTTIDFKANAKTTFSNKTKKLTIGRDDYVYIIDQYRTIEVIGKAKCMFEVAERINNSLSKRAVIVSNTFSRIRVVIGDIKNNDFTEKYTSVVRIYKSSGKIDENETEIQRKLRKHRQEIVILKNEDDGCNNIIYTNEPELENGRKTCIDRLKNCYKKILHTADKEGFDNIALPIIGTESGGFELELAVRILLTNINNFYVDLDKNSSNESVSLKEIIIVAMNEVEQKIIKKMLKDIENSTKVGERLLELNAYESWKAYKIEIDREKKLKKYTGILCFIRRLLFYTTRFFYPSYKYYQYVAKYSWSKKRKCAEYHVYVQFILPIIFISLYSVNILHTIYSLGIWYYIILIIISTTICIYIIFEIITYLSKLIFLADIQNPSANINRSILLTMIQYVALILCFDVLKIIIMSKDLSNNIFWDIISGDSNFKELYKLVIFQKVIIVYYVAVIFAYFVSQLKSREFID